MSADEAEAGHSREEGTLEWQLLQSRSQIASMLESPLPASAVLHPLYTTKLQQPVPTRATFESHLQHIRTSIRRFVNEATTVLMAVRQEESSDSKDDQSDIKAKKQRVISLLRENASHSTAISTASRQLQRTADWDSMLTDYPEVLTTDKTVDELFLEVARKQIQRFVQTCEKMAKDLKMEAFAEEHTDAADGNTLHTHTLTLAASIIVVDVEVFLDQQGDQCWKPLIRLRLSYATDSTTTKPILRDQCLADCLRIDLQAIANALLGYNGSTDMQSVTHDSISSITQHQARAKRTLETLKRLDDLSIGMHSSSKESSIPDLFAALDQVGRTMQSASPHSVEAIFTEAGLVQQHIGLPYTSLVYYADPNPPFASIPEVAAEMSRLTLSLVKEEPRLHFLRITVAKLPVKMLQSPSSPALPKIDEEEIDGTALHFTAILHPPVIMPKQTARMLSLKAGVVFEQEGPKSKKRTTADRLTNAPSYEDLVSASGRHFSGADLGRDLQFTAEFGYGHDTKRQGIVVSHFPFASLQHLSEAVVILRQQVQLNDLLRDVSQSEEISITEEVEVTLQDLLSDKIDEEGLASSRVSLAADESSGISSVLINVPLGIDIWTLEVKLFIQTSRWIIDATVSKLGQEQGRSMLEKESKIYKEITALLARTGGKGLKQILATLKTWALDHISNTVPGKSKEDLVSEVVEDQIGALVDVEKESPVREISESRSKGRRESVIDGNTIEPGKRGVSTRRRSSVQSPVEEKEPRRSTSVKRRASQAGIEEEEGTKRASRKRN